MPDTPWKKSVIGYGSVDRAAFLPHPAGAVAYWIVPAGRLTRHATTVKPGAVHDGAEITALCTLRIRWSFSTPPDGIPRSRTVTEECPSCRTAVTDRDIRSTVWDG